MTKAKTTMRTFLLASLVVSAALAESGSFQSNARAEIKQVQDEYTSALLRADTAALAKLWTDDYTFTNGSGIFLDKDDRLKNVKTGATEMKSIEETDRKIRLYGDDTAIITGIITIEGKYSQQASSDDYRYINIWIKRGDRWQMAANQITPIAE